MSIKRKIVGHSQIPPFNPFPWNNQLLPYLAVGYKCEYKYFIFEEKNQCLIDVR